MPPAPWQPTRFDPAAASAEAWRRLHAYRRQRSREWDPTEPIAPDAEAQKQIAHREPHWYEERFVVADADAVVGLLHVSLPKPSSPEYATNKDFMWTSGGVLASHRRRGVGRALLHTALGYLDRRGARMFNIYSEEPDGQAALEHVGFEVKQLGRRSRMDWHAVDWDMMQSWVDDMATRAPEATLELYPDRLPEDFLEEYCPAQSEMLNLMPFDDLEHGEIVMVPDDFVDLYKQLAYSKTEHHTVVCREADGTISGITDTAWRPSKPRAIQQWFTGVHPDYRGRGLGKAVKAHMLLFLRSRYNGIDFMQTENSQTNAAMLAINERMGFKPYRTGKMYQAPRDTVAAYLEGDA